MADENVVAASEQQEENQSQVEERQVLPPKDQNQDPAKVEKESQTIKVKVPEAYKDKGYIKNLVDAEGLVDAERLFKEIDGLEQVKGKKEILFDFDKATPEQLKAHLDKIRPATHEVYDFVNEVVAEPIRQPVQKLLHEAGLSKPQAKIVVEKYLAVEADMIKQATSKEGFEAELKTSFGEDFKGTASQTAKTIALTLDDNDRAQVEALPNKTLGLVYRIVNKLVRDYGIDETGIAARGGASGGTLPSASDAQAEVDKLYNEVFAISKRAHTHEEKAAAVKRYNDAQQRLFKIRGELK